MGELPSDIGMYIMYIIWDNYAGFVKCVVGCALAAVYPVYNSRSTAGSPVALI